ncbi:MAG: hypothetical protein V1848_03725 [Candidatus Magasanikbacteria bacterium]
MFEKKDTKVKTQYVEASGGLTNQQLGAGFWYVKHRLLLKQIGMGALLVFGAVTVLYSFAMWGTYFTYGFFKDNRNAENSVAGFQNYSLLQPLYLPQDVQVADIQIFSHTPDQYDFFARVGNPNKKYLVEVTHKFVYAGGETEPNTMVLFPLEEKRLATFGEDVLSYPSPVKFEIVSMRWKRIDPKSLADPQAFIAEHLDYTVDNFAFVQGSSDLRSVPLNSITFDITNESPFGYKDAEFIVELYDNGDMVGALPLSLGEFKTREKYSVDLRFGTGIPYVSEIKLIPLVNVFDREVYLNPEV